jgi:hypothetical protein
MHATCSSFFFTFRGLSTFRFGGCWFGCCKFQSRYHVLRQKGTEPAFSGIYDAKYEDYICGRDLTFAASRSVSMVPLARAVALRYALPPLGWHVSHELATNTQQGWQEENLFPFPFPFPLKRRGFDDHQRRRHSMCSTQQALAHLVSSV